MTHRPPHEARRRHKALEQRLLPDLAVLRGTLLEESARARRETGRKSRKEEHLCCKRPDNQMRISPLEARAIAEAFHTDPDLRAELPSVLERLEAEIPRLRDDGERQSFDCPLLDGRRCLVHRQAKPIGCLAWNPGRDYSKSGWRAFRLRDELNDAIYGPDWQLRVIPLWLKRVFRERLRHLRRRNAGSASRTAKHARCRKPAPRPAAFSSAGKYRGTGRAGRDSSQ